MPPDRIDSDLTGSGRIVASPGWDGLKPALLVCGEREAGEYVLPCQVREVFQDFFIRHSRCQVSKNIVNCDPHSANARLAAALACFYRDDLSIVHEETLAASVYKVTDGTIVTPSPIADIGSM